MKTLHNSFLKFCHHTYLAYHYRLHQHSRHPFIHSFIQTTKPMATTPPWQPPPPSLHLQSVALHQILLLYPEEHHPQPDCTIKNSHTHPKRTTFYPNHPHEPRYSIFYPNYTNPMCQVTQSSSRAVTASPTISQNTLNTTMHKPCELCSWVGNLTTMYKPSEQCSCVGNLSALYMPSGQCSCMKSLIARLGQVGSVPTWDARW